MDTSSRVSTTAAESSPATGPDPRIGQLVTGRYEILSKIGRGGMGAIYEALHLATGKRFAVKTLLPGLGKVVEIAQRFEREARAASSLAHPNIVSVVDFGALDDGALFLVMELVNGRSLSEVLEEGPIARKRALAICRQMLEALSHAHAHGVIHRDLKPDNIMLVDAGASEEERDIVKIVDFGIAKITGDTSGDKLTQAGVAFGTPEYMSPEQALGEETDARTDVYAVGVLLYEMLSGKAPFESNDKLAILRMQVAVSAPPLDGDQPPELEVLVARALRKRRDDRFAGADEMLAALDAAAAAQAERDAPVVSRPPVQVEDRADAATAPITSVSEVPVVQPRPLPAPRRRIVLAGGVVLLAVAAIVAATSGGPKELPPVLEVDPSPEWIAAGEAAAWRATGTAHAAAGRDVEAVSAWDRALKRAPGDTDPAMTAAVAAVMGRKQSAVAAVELLPAAGPEGRRLLVEQASRGKLAAARARARELCAGLGCEGVDLVSSYGLDLTQGASCRERREAIPRLRATGDKRAIPLLRRARGRTGGFLGLESVNACLDREAAEAMEFLQALP